MRKSATLCLLVLGAGTLSACASGGSLFNRVRPDEFAVTRQAPLVVPPDFALAPPNPGAPRPQDVDSSKQALDALFGGPAPRSAVETDALGKAGASAVGIRSTVGDPQTRTVAKGAAVQNILAAPQGDGAEAQAGTAG
ncbi:DUF3035 domain-containing protein [Novosphingobium cyanobacteriorum]|uniref:DUF3035 domain-containing protein n=1 Tax=Novosphingobium cyanobacteriorum TaxID=3024215 RepID=A0ABT6CH84_9SPHN|nr:DUF3035 domain-containing protein [Novosphingobium cyanobacteriorum]MDF8332843.1 DUF3035 domain-containing protein [Novosphingobium cyanobacteriorum]